MKKIRGDKPIWIIIHLYMKISQGNSFYSYLYPNKQKYYFFLFSSTKSENRRAEQACRGRGRAGISRRGKVVGKGVRRVNTVQKNVYTCM
jgi:hypothetical protein